jgi:S1-C subfamily serine protease
VEIVTIDENGSAKGLSTGFFISPDGQAVTNRHLVEGASSIAAINNNGAIFLFERRRAEQVQRQRDVPPDRASVC